MAKLNRPSFGYFNLPHQIAVGKWIWKYTNITRKKKPLSAGRRSKGTGLDLATNPMSSIPFGVHGLFD